MPRAPRPSEPVPNLGTLYSTGRDTIVPQKPDVRVWGKYSDGQPALLGRSVGKGRVLFFNGVYTIPYRSDVSNMPYWPNMASLVAALQELSGVKS